MFVIVIYLKKVHLEYAEQTLIFHKKIEAFQRLLSESTIYNLNKIVFFYYKIFRRVRLWRTHQGQDMSHDSMNTYKVT